MEYLLNSLWLSVFIDICTWRSLWRSLHYKQHYSCPLLPYPVHRGGSESGSTTWVGGFLFRSQEGKEQHHTMPETLITTIFWSVTFNKCNKITQSDTLLWRVPVSEWQSVRHCLVTSASQWLMLCVRFIRWLLESTTPAHSPSIQAGRSEICSFSLQTNGRYFSNLCHYSSSWYPDSTFQQVQ